MRTALVVLILCCPLSDLAAQDTTLAPGARLRVTSGHRVPYIETGRYYALTDTTLVLSRDTILLPLPLADISARPLMASAGLVKSGTSRS